MIWKPDTCDCVLEYNGSNEPVNFVRAIKKCKLHANIADNIIADTVLVHNRGFNQKFGNIAITDAQRDIINTDKTKEKSRIRKLP